MIGIIISLLLLALLLVVLKFVLDSMEVDGRTAKVVLLVVGAICLIGIFFGGWSVPMGPVVVRP